MEAVSNSTVLILLSRVNKINLLKARFSQIIIPSMVKDELLNSESKYKNSQMLIQKELNKFIKVEDPKKEINIDLGFGEKAAISLAYEKDLIFLSDDKKARRTAQLYKLNILGTLGVLLDNLKQKTITKKEFLKYLDLLMNEGYYMAPQLYSEIIKLIE